MTTDRPVPGIDRELTVPEALACALRILAAEGWQENLSGHITWADDDGGMWVNPWGLWWSEVRASDIMRVSIDGSVLSGKWDVTPVVFIHTELHRARPDARVIVHNHPYAATVLACLGVEPVISHQNACLFDDDLACIHEYDGAVESADAGRWLAEQVGKATGALLVNHGAIITAETIGAACYRAVTFERMCRMTLDALQAGRELLPLPVAVRAELKALLNRVTSDAYWDGAVRQLLAREPEVLD